MQGSFLYHHQGAEGGKSVSRTRVFTAAYVHTIKQVGDRILIIGGKSVALLNFGQNGLTNIVRERVLDDWVWDCAMVDGGYYFLTAHNTVIETDASLMPRKRFGCEEKCILYSGILVQHGEGRACVLAGSVFSQILIWEPGGDGKPSEAEVLHRCLELL